MKQSRKASLPSPNPGVEINLPREAWDFADKDRLPEDECEAAYIWEFCLGLGGTRNRDALLADKAGLRRQQEVWQSPAFQEWFKTHPCPEPSADDSPLDEWQAAALEAFPGCLYVPKLKGLHQHIVSWIFDWPEFPALHWQQIDKTVRSSSERRRPKDGMRRWQMGPERREAVEFGTVPGGFILAEDGIGWVSAVEPGFASLQRFIDGPHRGYQQTTKTPWGLAGDNRWEELRMVRVNWSRSNRKLKADFAEWLKDNRPDDRQDLSISNPKFSRGTTHREKLKALGAARVLAFFNGKAAKALKFAEKPENHMLPVEHSSWNKAEKKAVRFLREFDLRIFG